MLAVLFAGEALAAAAFMAGEGLFGDFFLLGGRGWGFYLVGAAAGVRFRSVVFDGVRLCSVVFGQLVGQLVVRVVG